MTDTPPRQAPIPASCGARVCSADVDLGPHTHGGGYVRRVPAGDPIPRAEVQRLIEAAVAEQRDMDLAMHQAYRPEVVAEVAVHLDDEASWEAIAAWCGGTIHNTQDPSGEYTSVIEIPDVGVAWNGSWITQRLDGAFVIRAVVEGPTPETIAAARAVR